jgi:hypothetical protein
MKYLKTFEGRFRGLDKQEIEDNIEGILVDLSDDNLIVTIDWLGGGLPNPNGLEIHIQDSNAEEFFISEDYIERFLTAVDYLKKQWGDVSVKYEPYNENIHDSTSFEDSNRLNYLGNLQHVTEFQITVQKLDSTPKKIDERLGISQDMEKQVEGYMKTIREKPISKVFKLLYQCDLGSYFFKLVIDSKISSEGYFTGSHTSIGDLEIHLKNREDESTLLHEVKHLDYYLRKKGKTKNIYDRMQRSISNSGEKKVSKRNLELLEHIFYIYDENEFQSKYTSFYKSFDLFLSKQNKDFTTTEIRELFFDYKKWAGDPTFSWYTVASDYDFTFDRFDETYKLKIDYGMSHIIGEVRTTTNKWRNTGYAKTWDDAGNQFIDVKSSPRFDTIIFSREKVRKRVNYDQKIPITFNWNEIKDQFIPFFIMLDRRYRVVNITFTDGKNIKGVRKEDIEKDIPFPIKQIYITVRK